MMGNRVERCWTHPRTCLYVGRVFVAMSLLFGTGIIIVELTNPQSWFWWIGIVMAAPFAVVVVTSAIVIVLAVIALFCTALVLLFCYDPPECGGSIRVSPQSDHVHMD